MKKKSLRNFVSNRMMLFAVVIVFVLLLLLFFSLIGASELVDIWWFDALGYHFYYWQRILYKYVIFSSVSIVFFLIFFLNFWVAARSLRRMPEDQQKKEKGAYRKILKTFQTGTLYFYVPLSLLLSIPLAMPLYKQWEHFLFYVFGQNMGVPEPFFGKDAAFYLFSLPIYTLLQQRLFFALLVLLAALFLLYMIKNRVLVKKLFSFSGVAKWHLSLIIAAVFGMEIWDLMLQRYALVYDTTHQPLFSGPGYVQMKVILPMIWASLGLLAATGISLLVVTQFKKGYRIFIGLVLLLALSIGARHSDFIPRLVQTYSVKPNEIAKESPFITKNIQATLDAYGLADVQIRNFEHQRFPVTSAVDQVQSVLRNIPVWDAEALEAVFKQLQELRSYYTFPGVSVGRYNVGGNIQQVFLAPRELEYDNVPGDANNWINNHLIYTHGYGAVMTPASQTSGNPMTWFIRDIPVVSDYGLDIEQPRMYYGLGDYPYAIAPNQAGEMDYPKGKSNVTFDYAGTGGIPISSLGRKFIFSYYLGEKNVFFSTKITSESKVLLRRNILDRVHTLAPYLLLDQTPYVTITPKGIFWILDGYTTSAWYPAAAPFRYQKQSLNYIRNSVKIVVDAYNGNVDFYIFDDKDPIINAYDQIYPGFFKNRADMPADLAPHVRYPKDLFDIQMQIYAKYHQTDPQVFFQQEDLWTFAEALGEETTVPLKPYYLTLDLIEPGKLDFMLLVPMFPKGRDNLRSMAVVGCDRDNYGKIIIYDFPKGELVYGPAQIDALINQDPTIAQQFTLWDQAGSSVVRGKMIILPVQNSILFIQPVYLKATSRVKIPELQRIIMSEGRVAVMETSLEDAYYNLKQRVQKEMQGIEDRFPKIPGGNTSDPLHSPGIDTEKEQTPFTAPPDQPEPPQQERPDHSPSPEVFTENVVQISVPRNNS